MPFCAYYTHPPLFCQQGRFIFGKELVHLDERSRWTAYLSALEGPFIKLARLDFLQPDGSLAFSIDNNPKNRRSGAFLQEGELSVNLQSGQRRQATVTLSNLDGEYDFNVNKIWFGQQIRLMEGLILPDGTDYYLPQGVFYVKDPEETFEPGRKTARYNLADKWSSLDGTLFGNLEGIYQINRGENLFTAIASLLARRPLHLPLRQRERDLCRGAAGGQQDAGGLDGIRPGGAPSGGRRL